jgi:hypothetical protein
MNEETVTDKRLPLFLMIAAFVSAAIFSFTASEGLREVCQVLFAECLGLALILFGVSNNRGGRVGGKRTYVYRDKNPRIFHALLYLKFFVPGIILLVAGLWIL